VPVHAVHGEADGSEAARARFASAQTD